MELGIFVALLIIELCAVFIAVDTNAIKHELKDMNRRRKKEDA